MDILFEKASEFIKFDDDITREELINILIEKRLISCVFEYLNDDEKKEHFSYIYFHHIKSYLKKLSFNNMVDFLIEEINFIDDYELYSICLDIVTEKDLEEFLDIFSVKLGDHYINKIIKSLSNDELKKKLITNYLLSNYYILDAIESLSDDYKEKLLVDIKDPSDQIKIILSFKDKEKIEKYVFLPEYSNYMSTLVAATKNKNFIIESFNKIKSNKFRIHLINKVESEELKIELITLLDDFNIKSFFLSNIECESELLSKLSGTPIDNKITIGVELECSNKEIDKYREIISLFNNYKITSDCSVKKGFEIVSPILKYDIKDLNTLKNVCNLLETNGFYTDDTAGGHIHIGASYLNKNEDYYMLLYLYINTENILYFISDRENSLKRKCIDRYASKNKKNYMEAIDNGMFEQDNEKIKDLFDKINESRYKGLNFKNLNDFGKNTIEFRMPNGEINFEELLLNIKLFARLVEMSHKLNESDDLSDIKVMAQKLGKCNKEIDRLEILLNVLFDNEEERQKYRDRYFANKRLYLLKLKNLINEFKTNFKAKELVAIEDNNHLVRSKH